MAGRPPTIRMDIQQPFVCIAVASYNRAYIIEETLRALLQQDYPRDRFEIVVVDNASSDDTVSIIQRSFETEIRRGTLKLYPLTVNTGSAGSYIHALDVARPDWDFFLKMDEDLVLDAGCLSGLVGCALSHRDAGMVGGKVYFYRERDVLNGVGSYLRPYFAIAKGIGVGEVDHGQFNEEQSYEGLVGCMVLISRRLKEKVGWFDSDYFLYYDDHELMLRGLRAGFRNFYTPRAVGYHDTGTATLTKFTNPRWIFYSTRGAWMFYFKNFQGRGLEGLLYLAGLNGLMLRQGIYIILTNFRTPRRLLANLRTFTHAYWDGATRKTRGLVASLP